MPLPQVFESRIKNNSSFSITTYFFTESSIKSNHFSMPPLHAATSRSHFRQPISPSSSFSARLIPTQLPSPKPLHAILSPSGSLFPALTPTSLTSRDLLFHATNCFRQRTSPRDSLPPFRSQIWRGPAFSFAFQFEISNFKSQIRFPRSLTHT